MYDEAASFEVDEEDNFEYVAKTLQDEDEEERLSTLWTLVHLPLSDERIVPYLQEAMNDTAVAILELPYVYGELRWLAAQALFREYCALGINATVELRGVPKPLDSSEMGEFLRDDSLLDYLVHLDMVDNYRELRDLGKIPIVDLVLSG
ncbi:hypothetical protein [Nocardia arizonensis]|uniref:hypothetical protein n=1 Tax=Nocardia arizonensis TaxID=1141647 RepID=UPI000B1E959E|nr:hypothetical protein [Nocardia arizonensis]